MSKKDKGNGKSVNYKVIDRRLFTSEGEPKKEEIEVKSTEDKAPSRTSEIDFITFVMSLGTSAMLHLGEIPHPETKEIKKNLVLAKETIDILGILKEKTQGNLTGEEERILEGVLYDLRMRYVQSIKRD